MQFSLFFPHLILQFASLTLRLKPLKKADKQTTKNNFKINNLNKLLNNQTKKIIRVVK